jgi:hypothetical protein
MRNSQGMTFPIALSTSPSSPSCVSAPRIGLVPPVPHNELKEMGLGGLECSTYLPIYQNFLQASVHEIGDQGAVITAYCFNSFTVHFIMNICFGKIQACISFLVDQQVWEIHLKKRRISFQCGDFLLPVQHESFYSMSDKRNEHQGHFKELLRKLDGCRF